MAKAIVRASWLIASLGGITACTGAVDGPPPASAAPEPNAAPPPQAASACSSSPAPDLLPSRILRLSDRQYANSVRALVGAAGLAVDVQTPGSSTEAFVENLERWKF